MIAPSGHAHPTGRLPGNANAIGGEIRRLDDLKERFWSTGAALRTLPIEGWEGAARGSFDDFRCNVATRWLCAGDLHEDAARALERYHETLVDLRRRVATAGPATMNPAAAALDSARWRQQLDSEARAAATAIRRATQGLSSLPRLREPAPPPPAVVPPAGEPPRRSEALAGLDPRTAQSDPALYRRAVQALNEEVLLADFIAIAPP